MMDPPSFPTRGKRKKEILSRRKKRELLSRPFFLLSTLTLYALTASSVFFKLFFLGIFFRVGCTKDAPRFPGYSQTLCCIFLLFFLGQASSKDREERMRRIKEQQEDERRRKLEELKQHVS